MDVLKKHIREMQECNELKVMYNEEIDLENQLLLNPNDEELMDEKRAAYTPLHISKFMKPTIYISPSRLCRDAEYNKGGLSVSK
jgi:hypothetical protein